MNGNEIVSKMLENETKLRELEQIRINRWLDFIAFVVNQQQSVLAGTIDHQLRKDYGLPARNRS